MFVNFFSFFFFWHQNLWQIWSVIVIVIWWSGLAMVTTPSTEPERGVQHQPLGELFFCKYFDHYFDGSDEYKDQCWWSCLLPIIPIWGQCQNWTKLQGGRPRLWQPLWRRLTLILKRKNVNFLVWYLCWTFCYHHLLTPLKGEDERSTAQGRRSAASQFRFVLKTTGKGSACQWGIKWVFGRH